MFFSIDDETFDWFMQSLRSLDTHSVSTLIKQKRLLKRASVLQHLKICRAFEECITNHRIARVLSTFSANGDFSACLALMQMEQPIFERLSKSYFKQLYAFCSAANREKDGKTWIDAVVDNSALSDYLSAYLLDKVSASTAFSKLAFDALIQAHGKSPKISRRYAAWSIKRSYLLGEPLSKNAVPIIEGFFGEYKLDTREMKLLSQLDLCNLTPTIHKIFTEHTIGKSFKNIGGHDPEMYLVGATSLHIQPQKWLDYVTCYFQASEASLPRLNDSGANLFERIEFAPITCSVPISKQPLISVIMPNFNQQNLIGKALDSLLNQSWQNFEVLVSDDGSQDDSLAIAREYATRDSRIKVLGDGLNRGTYAARNIGLDKAQGTFVTVNDSDDISLPERLETHAVHLMKDERPIGNYSMLLRLGEDGCFVCDHLGRFKRMNSSSFMFRREKVLSTVGYWDIVRFGADSELLDRVRAIHGPASVNVIDQPLMVCYYSMQNLTSLHGNVLMGTTGDRKAYRSAFMAWHAEIQMQDDFQPLTPREPLRRFTVPSAMEIDYDKYRDLFPAPVTAKPRRRTKTAPGSATAKKPTRRGHAKKK